MLNCQKLELVIDDVMYDDVINMRNDDVMCDDVITVRNMQIW